MAFRSPPPHRHSSGHRGGRDAYEKALIDLTRMAKRVGFDKLPLGDEKFRPLHSFFYGFTEARGRFMTAFDVDKSRGQRIYFGVMDANAYDLKTFADELQAALLKAFPREYIDEAVPVFTLGKVSTVYFEAVYLPFAALDSQKH